MINRQQKQQQAQNSRFQLKKVHNHTKSFASGAVPSNAPTLGKAQGLVITPHVISYLAGYISRHVHNPDDVNGRVQDTLLEALLAYPGFKGDSNLNTWLIGIAKHQIARYYRQAANSNKHLDYDDIALNDEVKEDEVYQALMLEEPLQMLSCLSKECQQVLYWHAVDGFSYAEIGSKLGISEDAVKHRIFRAKQVLRRAVKNKY